MQKINFNTKTAPIQWGNGSKPIATREKGLTIAALINKLVSLAAQNEIDLNSEVRVFDQDGKYIGVQSLQKGPGNFIVLR